MVQNWFFNNIFDFSTLYYLTWLLNLLLGLNTSSQASQLSIGVFIVFGLPLHYHSHKESIRAYKKNIKELVKENRPEEIGSLTLAVVIQSAMLNISFFFLSFSIYLVKLGPFSTNGRKFTNYLNLSLLFLLSCFSFDTYSIISAQLEALDISYKIDKIQNLEYLAIFGLLTFSNFSLYKELFLLIVLLYFLISNCLKIALSYLFLLGDLTKHLKRKDYRRHFKNQLHYQLPALLQLICEEVIFFASFFIITSLKENFYIKISIIAICVIKIERLLIEASTIYTKKLIRALLEQARRDEAMRALQYICFFLFCFFGIFHMPALMKIETICSYFVDTLPRIDKLAEILSVCVFFVILEMVNMNFQSALEVMNQKYMIYPIIVLSYMLIMPVLAYGGYRGGLETIRVLLFYMFIFSINKFSLLYLILFYGLEWEIETEMAVREVGLREDEQPLLVNPRFLLQNGEGGRAYQDYPPLYFLP